MRMHGLGTANSMFWEVPQGATCRQVCLQEQSSPCGVAGRLFDRQQRTLVEANLHVRAPFEMHSIHEAHLCFLVGED
jgi:hypothetical protein